MTTANPQPAPSLRISYWIRRNRYAGKCAACAQAVESGNGWTQKDGDKWQTICDTCAHAHAKYLPLDDRHVRALNDGHDGGNVYECRTCFREVALVKSNRTGKWFFCEVVETEAGIKYAATHQPHTAERCAARKGHLDELTADMNLRAKLDASFREWRAEIERRGGVESMTAEQTDAAYAELMARQNAIIAEGGAR